MKKLLTMRILPLVFVLFLKVTTSQSQILISLLLGDKLNTGKIEFGLEGGVNYSTIEGLQGDMRPNFNMGFYFDFKLKNPVWGIHTGVMVKSSMGIDGLPAYSLDNPNLDIVFAEGVVDRKINYFYVPGLMRYTFKNRLYLDGGIQLGLRSKARDTFRTTVQDKDDLKFTKEISDDYYRIDGGLAGGIGYKLKPGGMNLGIHYYYGLIDITANDNTTQHNRTFYITLCIPIGAAKPGTSEANGD